MENKAILEALETIAARLEAIEARNEEIYTLLTKRENQRALYKTKQDKHTEATRDMVREYIKDIFRNSERIRRIDLYAIIKARCKQDGKQPPKKHEFYKAVILSGYGLLKSNGDYYFTR